MSTATQTTLPITDTAQVSSVTVIDADPPFNPPYFLTDKDENVVGEVLADGTRVIYGQTEPIKAKPVRASFTRQHTATADKQARAICSSLAKAGHTDEANYLLHHWFPRKSSELIARAYEASKIKGSHIVLEMLIYERQQLTKFGNWDSLPRKVRQALS